LPFVDLDFSPKLLQFRNKTIKTKCTYKPLSLTKENLLFVIYLNRKIAMCPCNIMITVPRSNLFPKQMRISGESTCCPC